EQPAAERVSAAGTPPGSRFYDVIERKSRDRFLRRGEHTSWRRVLGTIVAKKTPC
ncbi:unnamed protein product, partial [Ixodes pacificus]